MDRGRGRGRGQAVQLPHQPPLRGRRRTPALRLSSAEEIDPNTDPIEETRVEEEELRVDDVDPEFEHTSTPRKRVADPSKWKQRQLKLQRREYRGCGCKRLKCDTKMTAEDVTGLRDTFNGFRDYNDQQKFLFSMISMIPTKQHLHQGEQSRRSKTFHYDLRLSSGDKLRVCKLQFLNVFSISDDRLQKLQLELKSGFLTPKKDLRGSHKTRPKAVTPELKNLAIDFVLEIVRLKGTRSHYQRRHSAGTVYLPHTLSVRRIWECFLAENDLAYTQQRELHRQHGVPMSRKPLITEDWFRDFLFAKEFGYVKFRLPKTDECGTCLSSRQHIAECEAKLKAGLPNDATEEARRHFEAMEAELPLVGFAYNLFSNSLLSISSP